MIHQLQNQAQIWMILVLRLDDGVPQFLGWPQFMKKWALQLSALIALLSMCAKLVFWVTFFNFYFMQVRTADPNAYYSCDDHFPVAEKINVNDGVRYFEDQSLGNGDLANITREALSSAGNS